MNIKLNARLRAYTRGKDFEEMLSILSSVPTEDGQYVLTVTVSGDTKTFSWENKGE